MPPSKQDNPQAKNEISQGPGKNKKKKKKKGEEEPKTKAEDEPGRGFDVYATPFVPEKLKLVNSAKGILFVTKPVKCFDFGAYAAKTLPPSLRHLPLKPRDASRAPTDQEPRLVPSQYELFFRFYLDQEIHSLREENASYSLYRHRGVVEFGPDGGARCTILVPGLRENSPYVEEDDIIELRQLRTAEMTKAAEGTWTNHCYGPAFFASHQPLQKQLPYESWTGNIFLARVSAVLRAKEMLVLRVLGLTEHTSETLLGRPPHQPLHKERNMIFNVQFPLPEERHQAVGHVIPQIQGILTAASKIAYQDQNDYDGLDRNVVSAEAHENKFWVQSMLFPTEADCDVQDNLHSEHFTQKLFDGALNWEQRKAVENICCQNYGVLPYLISGPPGTGKTKTLIETALQLVRNVDKVSHILMCAPSEPASDTLAARLKEHMARHELLRLNRPSRSFTEVPDTLLPYCHIEGDIFALPPFEQLMRYRVVVCSCRDASMLMYGRVTNTDLYAAEYGLRRQIHPLEPAPAEVDLHWDALLIDEAAQSTEPEALVPLYVVAPPPESPHLTFTPLFVMAGDEHQLGPRTASPTTPLKRSLFARLFDRPVYASHPLARDKSGMQPPPLSRAMLPILRPAFTNLIRNYRSHPAILAVPSALFYADTLEPEAPPQETSRLADWDGWQGRRWPVLFHANDTPDDLERDAGGWYNAGEAKIACQYAARLMASGLVKQEEICIMSPFKAQVGLIRRTIRAKPFSLWGVNVGPTEAFQGLESGVVILCVTRSRRRFVEKDKKLGWGVVGMPNKMNVALTRAKFGLIVVGSREVLMEDRCWRAVVGFCERNGLVAGRDVDAPDGGTGGGADSEKEEEEEEGVEPGAWLTKIEKMLLRAEDSGPEQERVLGRLAGEGLGWSVEVPFAV